jgi:hypothetical protein
VNEDFENFIVSRDAEVVADLWAKFEALGSYELATYAYSLGLYPPGFEEGQQHSISEYAPPGHEGRGYLVWSVGLWSPDVDDQDDEDDDDGDDPWAALGIASAAPDDGSKAS